MSEAKSETLPAVVETDAETLPVPLASKMDLKSVPFSVLSGRFVPETLQQALDYATLMAKSDFCVPPKFRGNPGACLAVAQQAWGWDMNPYAVVQKAYIVKDKAGAEKLAYEAQLVAAVVNTRAPVKTRPTVKFEGAGPTRVCVVTATFTDTNEAAEVRSPEIGRIGTKNSPLWAGDPDQQLAYYTLRSFGRRHCPEVLLGVYTPEEIKQMADSDAPVVDTAFLDDGAAPAQETKQIPLEACLED